MQAVGRLVPGPELRVQHIHIAAADLLEPLGSHGIENQVSGSDCRFGGIQKQGVAILYQTDGMPGAVMPQWAAFRRLHGTVFADGVAVPAVKRKGVKDLVFLLEKITLPARIQGIEVLQHANRPKMRIHVAGKIRPVHLDQPPGGIDARTVGEVGLVGGVNHVIRHAGHALFVRRRQIRPHRVAGNRPAGPVLPHGGIVRYGPMMPVLPVVKLQAVDVKAA